MALQRLTQWLKQPLSVGSALRPLGWMLASVLGLLVVLPVLLAAAVVAANLLISDTTLARLVAGQLNDHLPGDFTLGAISWELPLTFAVTDAEVSDPEGQTAIVAQRIAGRIDPWELLHLHVHVTEVRVARARVLVQQAAPDARTNLEQTFVADPNVPPSEAPMGWSLQLDDIAVESSRVVVEVPGTHVLIRSIDVQDSRLWLRDWTLGVDAQLTSQAIVRLGKTRLPFAHLALRAEDVQYRFGGVRRDVTAKLLAVQTDGLRIRAKGAMQATMHALETFTTQAEVRLDSARLAQLPKPVRERLHGQADMHVEVHGDAALQKFSVQLQSQNLAVHDVLVSRLTLRGRINAPQIQLAELTLRTNAGTLEGHGDFTVTAGGAGAHDLQVKMEDVPLRRLLEPYVQAGMVLPQRMNADLAAKGPGLWPLGSRLEVNMTGFGIAAATLPGVPDPMELHGRMLLLRQGVKIEVLALQGEGVDFAIHGEVPWKPDNLVGVLMQFKRVPKGRTNKQLMLPLGERRQETPATRLATWRPTQAE